MTTSWNSIVSMLAPDTGPPALRIARWTARIASVFSIALLSLFLFGGAEATPSGIEWLMLAAFPIGVMLGMIISWRNEVPGGVICTVSLAVVYTVFFTQKDRPSPGIWFLVFASPGIMLMIVGLLSKRYAR